MDLICDINGTTSRVGDGTFSFLRGLEVPDDGVESWMLYDFGGSERHISSWRGKNDRDKDWLCSIEICAGLYELKDNGYLRGMITLRLSSAGTHGGVLGLLFGGKVRSYFTRIVNSM